MDPGPGWTILATSRAVQARTGKSLRAAIRQLPPLRSAIITANGATATIPPALDHATTRLLSTLTNPEPRHQDEYANSGRKTSPPTPTPTRQPRPDHRPPHRYTLNCEEPECRQSEESSDRERLCGKQDHCDSDAIAIGRNARSAFELWMRRGQDHSQQDSKWRDSPASMPGRLASRRGGPVPKAAPRRPPPGSPSRS